MPRCFCRQVTRRACFAEAKRMDIIDVSAGDVVDRAAVIADFVASRL
jgi:hypothetical protein